MYSAMHLECTHSTFNSFLDGWCRDIWHPRALRDSRENTEIHRAIHANAETRTERDEMKTKQILKISAAPAGVLCALAFFSTATPAAAAPVDYCRTDTSGMRGCGFSSLEQCQAMASGRGSITVTRIHSRRAAAPAATRAPAANRAAAPMPISRSTLLRRAQGSRLSTNRTASAD